MTATSHIVSVRIEDAEVPLEVLKLASEGCAETPPEGGEALIKALEALELAETVEGEPYALSTFSIQPSFSITTFPLA